MNFVLVDLDSIDGGYKYPIIRTPVPGPKSLVSCNMIRVFALFKLQRNNNYKSLIILYNFSTRNYCYYNYIIIVIIIIIIIIIIILTNDYYKNQSLLHFSLLTQSLLQEFGDHHVSCIDNNTKN